MDKKEKEPLPKGWIARTSKSRCPNAVYYYHPESRLSVWSREEINKEIPKNPAVKSVDIVLASGRKYKTAVRTGKSTADLTLLKTKKESSDKNISIVNRLTWMAMKHTRYEQCKNSEKSSEKTTEVSKKSQSIPEASDVKKVIKLQAGTMQIKRTVSSSEDSESKRRKFHCQNFRTNVERSVKVQVPLPSQTDKVASETKTPKVKFSLFKKQLAKKVLVKINEVCHQQEKKYSSISKSKEKIVISVSKADFPSEAKSDQVKNKPFSYGISDADTTTCSKETASSTKQSSEALFQLIPSSSKSDDDVAVEYMEYTNDSEPDDDVIMVDLQEIREQISSKPDAVIGDLTKALHSADSGSQIGSLHKAIYVIVDTNVLIRDLKLLNSIKDNFIKEQSDIFIVIPWLVLQELDALKENRSKQKSTSLSNKCQNAVKYLNNVFSNKHPRFIGQNAKEAFKKSDFRIEVNDDRILQCCFQFAEKGSSKIILFTNDRNLINKAQVNGFEGHTSETIYEVLKQLQNEKKLPPLQNVIKPDSNKVSVSVDTSKIQNNLVNNILSQLKDCLKEALEAVLETEMKNAFGEIWLKVVWTKPPWSFNDILICISKHWIAVFSFFLKKRDQAIIEALKLVFKGDKVASFKPESLLQLINDCLKLLQNIEHHSSYGDTLPRCLERLGCLQQSTKEKLQEKQTSQLEIAHSENKNEPVDGSFQLNCHKEAIEEFQLVWENINFYCGFICDTLHFPHQLIYKRPELFPNAEEAVQFASKLFTVVHRLCTELNSVLDAVRCNSDILPEMILRLFQSLVNFSANLNVQTEKSSESNLTPHMLLLFCRHPDKRELLENGHQQLVNFLTLIQQCLHNTTGRMITPEGWIS